MLATRPCYLACCLARCRAMNACFFLSDSVMPPVPKSLLGAALTALATSLASGAFVGGDATALHCGGSVAAATGIGFETAGGLIPATSIDGRAGVAAGDAVVPPARSRASISCLLRSPVDIVGGDSPDASTATSTAVAAAVVGPSFALACRLANSAASASCLA